MAALYVKPTRQHSGAARLIRRARVPIVSLILLWKISICSALHAIAVNASET